MIRLSKLTDYGLVLMSYAARNKGRTVHTARELSLESGLPLPTVSKLLKLLLQAGFLVSHRGTNGGYSLAREPEDISVAEIIAALEGPIALTECSTDISGLCDFERGCPIKTNQRIINQVVRAALEKAQAEPKWANIKYAPINYQNISYYSAPKRKPSLKSLEELDPELLRTYEKLGIPLEEQKLFAGVAVDAVFDSVSVATTFKEKLADIGVIFCSFSEAVQKHPELVQKYLGTVVPYTDNFFASLNASVFTDGSFVYVPKGVRCPLELSTYFRINAAETGQFERTLIVADEGSYVSYLEGCTAPIRDENQLHAAVVELIALDNAQIKYSTVQNWYPGDKEGKGGIFNFVTKRGKCQGVNSKIS